MEVGRDANLGIGDLWRLSVPCNPSCHSDPDWYARRVAQRDEEDMLDLAFSLSEHRGWAADHYVSRT